MQISFFIYRFLSIINSLATKIGLLKNDFFRKIIFLPCYFRYKKYLEDPFFSLTIVKPELFCGGSILDIGANVGYTASVFSKIISPGYKIYSLEPEKNNFLLLSYIIRSFKLQDKVLPFNIAIGDEKNVVSLWRNINELSDSKILTNKFKQGLKNLDNIEQVSITTIDDFVKEVNVKLPIKFIKIDVQGYEFPVCEGMQETLLENPNAVIAVEYSPGELERLGFNHNQLIDFFLDRKYFLYIVLKNGKLERAFSDRLDLLIKSRTYIDLLCSKIELIG